MNRRDRQNDNPDGVRVTARPHRTGLGRWGWLVVVILAVGTGWWLSGRHATRVDTSPGAERVGAGAHGGTAGGPASAGSAASRSAGARAAAGAPGPSPSSSGRSPAGVDGEDSTPDLSDYVLPGEAPSMAQVITALHARGIRTGLGAFQPPGTSPPLRGLEVPAGFQLPDGYVRHHQATDDGQRIAPILMFAPDRDSIVVRGVRVPIPENRVVSPDLAPPGLPLRWVRIPPPRDGGRS